MSSRSDGRGAEAAHEDEARLYGRALRLLTAHDRTAHDLRRRLERYADADTVGRVLARLREQRYLDDERFARTFTEREALERGAGAQLVRASLRAHGVAEPLVREAAETAAAAEAVTALSLARKRAARLRGLAHDVQVRRLAGQLARRGYRAGVVYEAVRAALAEHELDEAGAEALEWLGSVVDGVGAEPETEPETEAGAHVRTAAPPGAERRG